MAASGKYRRLVALAVVGAGLVAAGAGVAPALADSSTYVGGAGGVIACHGPGQLADQVPIDTPGVGIGGACFSVPPGATTAAVSTSDDLNGTTAIEVSGHYPDQTNTDRTLFCEGSGTWAIPQGVSVLFVTEADPVTSGCTDGAVPVKGTISVSFS